MKKNEIIGLVGLCVVIALFFLTQKDAGVSGEYKAVTLVNGQLYFGILINPKSDFPVLKDSYHLFLRQGTSTDQVSPELVKIGEEFYKPQDSLSINRAQILFVQDLTPESPILKAILEAKTQKELIK